MPRSSSWATPTLCCFIRWRSYFNKLNKFEKQIAKTYNLTYVAIPNTETTIDVHPTIKGHQYIANKLVNAIENP